METIRIKSYGKLGGLLAIAGPLIIVLYYCYNNYGLDFEQVDHMGQAFLYFMLLLLLFRVVWIQSKNLKKLNQVYPAKNGVIEIPQNEIEFISYGKFIKTTRGEFDTTQLLFSHPDVTMFNYDDLREKYPNLKSQNTLNYSKGALMFSLTIVAVFVTMIYGDYIKYYLPLKKIEVVEIEATVSKETYLTNSKQTISPRFYSKEFPQTALVLTGDHSLRTKKKLEQPFNLPKGEKVKLKIRPADLDVLKIGMNRSVRVYSLERNGKIEFEKDKLSY